MKPVCFHRKSVTQSSKSLSRDFYILEENCPLAGVRKLTYFYNTISNNFVCYFVRKNFI